MDLIKWETIPCQFVEELNIIEMACQFSQNLSINVTQS